MKIVGSFIALVFLIFVAGGIKENASRTEETTKEEGVYQDPWIVAQKQSEEIWECIENKDAEKLKSLFCPKIQDTHNLDLEIERFFQYIDGEIISYDRPYGNYGGGSKKDGIDTESHLWGRIKNINTDTGKIYSIGFESYLVYKKDEEYEGVNEIYVIDVNLYADGYLDDGKRIIGQFDHTDW